MAILLQDIAAKLTLLAGSAPLSDATVAALQTGVTGYLTTFHLDHPDVRVRQGVVDVPVVFISVWRDTVPHGSSDDAAREAAATAFTDPGTDPLKDLGVPFGIFASSSFMFFLAQNVFAALPHTYDEAGFADQYGNIYLTGIGLGFPSADEVKRNVHHYVNTFVHGYYQKDWVFTVHFTQTLTDQLKSEVPDPAPPPPLNACFERLRLKPTVTATDDRYAAFFLAFPLTLLPAIDAAINGPQSRAPDGPAVGGSVFLAFPEEIALPRAQKPVLDPIATGANATSPPPQKFHFCYASGAADNRGLFASAFPVILERTPTVEIAGPTELVIDKSGSGTFGNYTAVANDFFGDLTFQWAGGGVYSAPQAADTAIAFPRGNTKPGDTFHVTIHVTVTDKEGAVVTASAVIAVTVSTVHVPVLCKNKPWLKQCQNLS